jgi:hypothetical protein
VDECLSTGSEEEIKEVIEDLKRHDFWLETKKTLRNT